MREIVSDRTMRYAMAPLPKDIKKILKKNKIKVSKKCVFIPLIDEKNPDAGDFAIVDEEYGKMILYIDENIFLLDEVKEENTCDKDKVAITVYEDPTDGNVSFEIVSFMIPPRKFCAPLPIEGYNLMSAFYYELAPYAYLYIAPFVKKLEGPEKDMYLDKISKILEIKITDDIVCDIYRMLIPDEIERIQKAIQDNQKEVDKNDES